MTRHSLPPSPPYQHARMDSADEPVALSPARWPPRTNAAPSARARALLQRAMTVPAPRTPDPCKTPLQISPLLTPSMRSALPQPKAVRPRAALSRQSDLSAASTRAENEPPALRDLRRVTAPPAMMDPWQFEREARAIAKSHSATSVVTDRLSDAKAARRERWTQLPERRSGVIGRVSSADLKRLRRRLWPFVKRAPVMDVPDRFHGSFSDRSEDREPPEERETQRERDRERKEADSVLSVLTRESAESTHVPEARMRGRSVSEFGMQRRSSFVVGKEKVVSIWEKLFRKKKLPPSRAPDRPNGVNPVIVNANPNVPNGRVAAGVQIAQLREEKASLHRVHSLDESQPQRHGW